MNKKMTALSFLVLYVLVKFVFVKQLDSLGEYASYIFEVFFVLITGYVYRSKLKFKFPLSKSYFIQLIAAVIFGFFIFNVAAKINLVIPFDLNSKELILFLLIIGPVIEELVFRQALWFIFEEFFATPVLVMLATTLIFAFGHFIAYFYVPPEFHMFVIYQTSYVLIIGLWWAWVRSQKGSISATIPLHFLFNLGFYLGFLNT